MIGDTRIFLLVFTPGQAWNMVVSGLHAIWGWSLVWILASLALVLGVLFLVSAAKLKRRIGALPRHWPEATAERTVRRAALRGRRLRWTAVAVLALVVASIATAFLTTVVEERAAEVQPSAKLALPPSLDIWTGLRRAVASSR